MHGIIFSELQKYGADRFGGPTWSRALERANLTARKYSPLDEYPCEEAHELVSAASHVTGTPIPALWEDYGFFIVPDLVRLYSVLLDPTWRTLDVLERAEECVHKIIESRDPCAPTPQIHATRLSATEVVIRFGSPRICNVSRGVARGLASHFDEAITINETACLDAGAPECVMHVTRPPRRHSTDSGRMDLL